MLNAAQKEDQISQSNNCSAHYEKTKAFMRVTQANKNPKLGS